MSRKSIRYWLALALTAAIMAGYASHRNLHRRFKDYLKSEADIQARQDRTATLEGRIEQSRERVESLGSDPLEIEADIRRHKTLVRDGERIYRIEEVPADRVSPHDPGDVSP